MAEHTKTEIGVGLFMVLGVAALAYLSLSLGSFHLFQPERTILTARFATAGNLKEDAPVKLAGVRIGQVVSVQLKDYEALVTLRVDPTVALPSDTIASIQTEGLLGESFVSLSPGAADQNLRSGDRIAQTEPPLDLMDLLAKYVFGPNKPAQ